MKIRYAVESDIEFLSKNELSFSYDINNIK